MLCWLACLSDIHAITTQLLNDLLAELPVCPLSGAAELLCNQRSQPRTNMHIHVIVSSFHYIYYVRANIDQIENFKDEQNNLNEELDASCVVFDSIPMGLRHAGHATLYIDVYILIYNTFDQVIITTILTDTERV
jgi:hypothetical protein